MQSLGVPVHLRIETGVKASQLRRTCMVGQFTYTLDGRARCTRTWLAVKCVTSKPHIMPHSFAKQHAIAMERAMMLDSQIGLYMLHHFTL